MVKKVFFVSGAPRVSTKNNSSAGGPRSHILGIVRAFESLGYDIKQYIAGDEINEKVSTVDTSVILKKWLLIRILSDFARLLFRYTYRLKARKKLGSGATIIYERYAAFQEIGSYLRGKEKNVKWILESNGLYYYEATIERQAVFFRRLLKFLERKAYKSADLIVCISNDLANRIVTQLGIDSNKIIVVPNGVDTNFFNPTKSIKSEKDSFIIGFVGTLIKYQRLDILFEAAKILKNEGFDFLIHIVGDGIELTTWKKLSSDMGLSDRVIFFGRVALDKIPSVIGQFDVGYSVPDPDLAGKYVSPLKLYEYMSMGIPVIAYPTEDASRLVTPQNGFLLKGLEPIEIANTIKAAVKLDLASMGNQARADIVKSHSWKNRLEMILGRISIDQNE